MSEQDASILEVLNKIQQKRIHIPRSIQRAREDIERRFPLAKMVSRATLIKLWERIVQDGVNVELTTTELGYVSLVLFLSIDRDHPALFTEELFVHILGEFERLNPENDLSMRQFAGDFVLSEIPPETCSRLLHHWQSIVHKFTVLTILINDGYLSKRAGLILMNLFPKQIHESLSKTERTHHVEALPDAYEKGADGVCIAQGDFFNSVLLQSTPIMRDWIKTALKNASQVEPVFAALERSLLDDHANLRLPAAIETFFESILAPLKPGPERGALPTPEFKSRFLRFCNRVLGLAKNSRYPDIWNEIFTILKDIELGEEIHLGFKTLGQIVKDSREWDMKRMWGNREKFWLTCWMHGLIKTMSIYIDRKYRSSDLWENSPLKVDINLFFIPRFESKFVVMMEMVDGVWAIEASHNGKLRFYRDKPTYFLQTLDYSVLKYGAAKEIVHHAQWQQQAYQALSEYIHSRTVPVKVFE